MSDYEESEIEASFDYCGNFMNVDKARAELAALRAQAAEAETLRATIAEQARKLEAAHMQIAVLDDYAEKVLKCESTIAEQARQLEQARAIMENFCGVSPRDMQPLIAAWLAANAPAQTKAEETNEN